MSEMVQVGWDDVAVGDLINSVDGEMRKVVKIYAGTTFELLSGEETRWYSKGDLSHLGLSVWRKKPEIKLPTGLGAVMRVQWDSGSTGLVVLSYNHDSGYSSDYFRWVASHSVWTADDIAHRVIDILSPGIDIRVA